VPSGAVAGRRFVRSVARALWVGIGGVNQVFMGAADGIALSRVQQGPWSSIRRLGAVGRRWAVRLAGEARFVGNVAGVGVVDPDSPPLNPGYFSLGNGLAPHLAQRGGGW
jgi:hypothetical protein